MTPRKRSQDLTADLLRDLEAEDAVTTTPKSATPATSRGSDPAPSLETAVYLAPRDWRRPAVSRAGRSVSITAGPLRLRIGRRPA